MHRMLSHSLQILRGIAITATLLPSISIATTQLNHIPQPWRQQAVVFGSDEIADLRRREPTLSGQFRLPLTDTVTLRPEIYLSAPDIQRLYSETDAEDHQGFTGKIALPFEVVLSGKENAILTLSPNFYLHKPAFGGGNLQLHWPM